MCRTCQEISYNIITIRNILIPHTICQESYSKTYIELEQNCWRKQIIIKRKLHRKKSFSAFKNRIILKNYSQVKSTFTHTQKQKLQSFRKLLYRKKNENTQGRSYDTLYYCKKTFSILTIFFPCSFNLFHLFVLWISMKICDIFWKKFFFLLFSGVDLTKNCGTFVSVSDKIPPCFRMRQIDWHGKCKCFGMEYYKQMTK